mmetsp:Transcript_6935/g.9714  ORF Transcript_6935/g.9714 Transcript_6935/m.9714 type:complete len:148 (-) Transcript_6935:378-821(-)
MAGKSDDKPRRSTRAVQKPAPVPAPAKPVPAKKVAKAPVAKPVVSKKKKAPPTKKKEEPEPAKKKAKTDSDEKITIKKGTPLFDGEDWVVFKRQSRKIDDDDPLVDGAWYAKPDAKFDAKNFKDVCEWSGMTEIKEWAIAAKKYERR